MGLFGLFKQNRGEAVAATPDARGATTPEQQEPWYPSAIALGEWHMDEMDALLDSGEMTADGANEMQRRHDTELAEATKGMELVERCRFDGVYRSAGSQREMHPKATPEEHAAQEASAVEMAKRHFREWEALFESSERSEAALPDMRKRQKAELDEAKKNMAVQDAFDFGEAYGDTKLEETARSCTDGDEPGPTDPIAEALARRHGSERLAYIEDDSHRLDRFETDNRHRVELAEAVQGMEESEAEDFNAVYTNVSLNLMVEEAKVSKAVRKRREAETAELCAEIDKYDEVAEEGLKLIAEGKPVAEWVRDAYDRGRADGHARIAAAQAGQEAPSTELGLPCAPRTRVNAVQRLYTEGENKGADDAVDEAVAAAAASAKPSILEGSSFWDHRVAPIHFLAGDFGEGTGHLLHSGKIEVPLLDQVFSMDAVQSVELITQQNIKRVAKSWGWGLVGAAAFGPAGLVAGALVGGNENSTTFAVTLMNGQRFLAVATAGVHAHFLAAAFARGSAGQAKA